MIIMNRFLKNDFKGKLQNKEIVRLPTLSALSQKRSQIINNVSDLGKYFPSREKRVFLPHIR